MKDKDKTKAQLIAELDHMRQRCVALEAELGQTEPQRDAPRAVLRESEQRYRSLLDGMPVGLYRTTPTGQIVDANPALVEMLGYPDQEAMLAVNVDSLYIDPEERVRWQAQVERGGNRARLRNAAATTQWRVHLGKEHCPPT